MTGRSWLSFTIGAIALAACGDGPASKPETLVSRIERAASGAEFSESPSSYVAGHTKTAAVAATFRSSAVRFDPDGMLHIELDVCPDDWAACAQADAEWDRKITHVAVEGLNPDDIGVHRPATDDGGGDGTGMYVSASCRQNMPACARNEGMASDDIVAFISCAAENCETITNELKALAEFAATPAFEGWLAQQRDYASDATEIGDWQDAQEALLRISNNMSDAPYEVSFEKAKAGVVSPERHLLLQHDRAGLENNGALRIAGSLCIADETCGVDGYEQDGTFRFHLPQIDPENIRVREISRRTMPIGLWLGCLEGVACIDEALGQYDQRFSDFLITCLSPEACVETMRDVRGLMRFVRDTADPYLVSGDLEGRSTPKVKRSKRAREIETLVVELDHLIRGARYQTRDTAAGDRVLYLGRSASLRSDGRLAIELNYCRFSFGASCDDRAQQGVSVSLANLARIDPHSSSGSGFDETGNAIDALGIVLDWTEVAGIADSLVMTKSCKDSEACIDYVNASRGSRLYLPCRDLVGCERAADIVGALADLAVEANFTSAVVELDGILNPATRIRSAGDARKAMERISDNLAAIPVGFSFEQVSYTIENVRVTLEEGQDLVTEIASRIESSDDQDGDPSEGEIVMGLLELARDELIVGQTLEDAGWQLTLNCAFEWCAYGLIGWVPYDLDSWSLACEDRASCETIASDVRGLIDYIRAEADKPEVEPKAAPAPQPAQKSGDLVGVWELLAPYQPNWVVEYRTDGTYLFTIPNARINGVYEAKDGSFSTRAPDIGSEDRGSYRLIDEDTLEMTGNLGVSIWKRRR